MTMAARTRLTCIARRRMAARHEHFMPLALLDSQFATLQESTPDEHAIVVDVCSPPAEIATEIVQQLEERRGNVGVIESPSQPVAARKTSTGERQ